MTTKPRFKSLKVGSVGLKKESIQEQLRERIVSGRWAPGARLPTRRELEQQFGVSTETVQRALHRLQEDEWVSANGRRGTHVVLNPPHLSRYALVFRHHPQRDALFWTRFYSALSHQAHLHRAQARRIFVFSGIDGNAANGDYQRLLREVRGERFAGLIFADGVVQLADSPLFQNPDLPRVSLGDAECESVMTVRVDEHSFVDRALDHLKSRGRKRLAVLSHRHGNDEYSDYLAAGIDRRGFQSKPIWMQSASVEFADATRNVMRLLFDQGQKERPDALILTDDNFSQHATSGLAGAGIRADELEIVSHCNFPDVTPSFVPALRLGYDTRHILQTCLAHIDARRHGENVSPVTNISALFENEVPSNTETFADA